MHEPPRKNLAARMGGWSARHRWAALGLWFAFVIAAIAGGTAAGQINIPDARLGDGQSGHVNRLIDDAGFDKHANEMVLVQSDSLTVHDSAFRAAIGDTVRTLAQTDNVTNIEDPLNGDSANVSKDGHSALVRFDVPGDETELETRIVPIMDRIEGVQKQNPDVSVRQFGDASAAHTMKEMSDSDLKKAGNLSLPLTLIILIIAFGALVAAGIPVLLAFSAVLATFGLNSLVSHLIPSQDIASEMILMIGMAVGVDYSLFYLQRGRQERAATKRVDVARIKQANEQLRDAKRSHDPEAIVAAKKAVHDAKASSRAHRLAALDIAASTSGQAVLISGITVLIAMAGMLVSGNDTFIALAIASMLVVAAAMIGSLTGLPAIISLLGDRVERGRVSRITAPLRWVTRRGNRVAGESARRQGAGWGAIVDRVLRRPLVSVIVAGGVLLALAVPALSIKTETPTFKFLPHDSQLVQTYNDVQTAFPGDGDPAIVAIKADDVTSPETRAAIADFKKEAVASGQASLPMNVEVNPDNTVATITVPIAGDGSNQASRDAVTALRDTIIPATLDKVPGSDVGVTGSTAGSMDFNSLMKVRTPLVFVFVLGLAFILMLLTFRSIVIPIKAIVLNLLSVGAAYGILVMVFQKGWGESLLGFQSTGTIANWLPLFLFVVLFGLSMDYHVFILSRVKELVDNGMRTEDAVSRGIKDTAGTVTSAAIVMVVVFGLFATLSMLDVKQMGFGAAVAVLLDATIIRAVLLPATMKLLGEWNWYLPRWLDWLPTINHGSDSSLPETEAARA
jgi:putative drug exporter of the RND superfamily